MTIEGVDRPTSPEDVVNALNSGTTLRFATAVAGLVPSGDTVLTGDRSLRQRPMQPLLSALRELGVRAWSTRRNGCAPLVVRGGGVKGGTARVRGDVSSQFISALLIASLKADKSTRLAISTPMVSRPYVQATLAVVHSFGGIVQERPEGFRIDGPQKLRPTSFVVPGDFSAAALIAEAAVISGGRVRIRGLNFNWPQGDRACFDYLRTLGARVVVRGESVRVEAGVLRGGIFNLRDTPDLLPPLAAVAAKATVPVRLTGLAHARFKETDRLRVIARELHRVGVKVKEYPDGLQILGRGQVEGGVMNAHDDHRLFMAFAALALGSERGITIEGMEALDVSYPGFLRDLQRLGARVEGLP
jgi:3-phosphoshikimate 1-carboxyvinyltransferase